jgi:hypothetical protein
MKNQTLWLLAGAAAAYYLYNKSKPVALPLTAVVLPIAPANSGASTGLPAVSMIPNVQITVPQMSGAVTQLAVAPPNVFTSYDPLNVWDGTGAGGVSITDAQAQALPPMMLAGYNDRWTGGFGRSR